MAQPFGALREALLAALTPLRAHQVAELLPSHILGALLPLLPELAEMLPERSLSLLPVGKRSTAKIHAALTSLLLALGQVAPQVLVLEDLHWFDQATLGALVALLPALRSARVLLLLSGRTDELAGRPAVWDALLRLDRSGLMRRLELRGLSASEVADLIRRALRMRQEAPRFSARLYEATGGNPFFVLETLRALVEQGRLSCDAQGVWHTPWDAPQTDYRELPLPAGLQQAIDTRLRELAPEARNALAAAAVLGQSFTPSVWATMTADDRPPATGDRQQASGERSSVARGPSPVVVEQLLRRQFLTEDSTGYRFEHEMLRELVYDDLDTRTRRTLHLRAAEALEQEHYARVEALAQHLYLAGAWDKAMPYLVQAGDRARAVCAYRDALRNYDQALDAGTRGNLQGADLLARWSIQIKRGEVATLLGDYAIAIAAYEEPLQLAVGDSAAPDTGPRSGARRSIQIQALNGLSYVYGLRNEYPHARATIQQAMTLATASPHLLDRAEVFYQAGLISFRTNDYAEARHFLQEAIQLYDALGLDLERAKCLVRIGWSYLRQDGPTDQVIDHFTQALEIYRQQDDRFGEHSCLADIASAQLMRGRLVEGAEAVDHCLPFFRSIGALDDVSSCLFTRGEAYRRMGHLEQALESLRESFTICIQQERNIAAEFNQVVIAATLRDMGRLDEALETLARPLRTEDHWVKARALLIATDIRYIQAELDQAWGYLEEGLALARALGSKAYMGIAYRLLGQLQVADSARRRLGDRAGVADVAANFAESVRLLQEAHYDDELALTSMVYGQYLLSVQRPAEARTALLQAQTLMSRCGMASALAQVQPLLQSLSATPAALQPDQRRVLLARRGVPRGRPLRPDELVEVIWTVEEPNQPAGSSAATKASLRQERLRRLCAEANAQGAEPTVSALADALGVTARTVDRDIAALRAAGEILVTRGANERQVDVSA